MEIPIIKISNFDGPFDLLLHLIKKNEMSISEIKILEIINQYLEYLDVMKKMDLDITSEFIVMAATLIEIKSKALLPKVKKESNNEVEEDLEDLLKQKLIEYTRFKKVSEYFKKKDLMYGEVFTKNAEIIEVEHLEVNDSSILKNLSMKELYALYLKLIQRYNDKQNTNNVIERKINVDKYKISDKISFIQKEIVMNSIMTFSDLSSMCECKLEVVVTFLAVLEMIKLEEIKIVQYDNFDEIIIEKVEMYE